MNKPSLSSCPVPEEQQPLNEYEQLRESWLFRWATLGQWEYGRKLVWVWAWGWLVAGPITAASFAPNRMPLRFALCGSAGAGLLVVLMLVRIYLGWSYVRDRLTQAKISYEESGWYDGQTWKKPSEVLTRDRLIASYEIRPILQRLQATFAILALLVGLGSLSWLLFVKD